jgi:hypothetical protein
MNQAFLYTILWNFFIFILPAACYTICKNITLMTFRYTNRIDLICNKLHINGYPLNRSLAWLNYCRNHHEEECGGSALAANRHSDHSKIFK